MAKVKSAKLLNSVKVIQKESTYLSGKEYDMQICHVESLGFLKVVAKAEVLYIPMSNVNYLVFEASSVRIDPPQGNQPQGNKPQGVSGQQGQPQNQSRPA